MRKSEDPKVEFASPSFSIGYSLSYSAGISPVAIVRKHTLLDLYDRYHGILWENGSHKDNVSAFIREIDTIICSASFSTFSQETVDTVISALRNSGNSNATINRKMAALSKLLRKALKMGDIHSLPEFRRQKERAGRIRFLDREEENRLFAAIQVRSVEYYRLSVFLVDTGARLGEAIALRWGDISERRATFWLTKSRRSRSIPLTDRAFAAMGPPKARRGGPFIGIQQQQYRKVWNEAKEEVGLGHDNDVVPHVLRHTCASRLVRGGIDLRRVQTWLGHQTLTMTMRYAHLATHDLDMCIPILERD
ncbi:tyrosine-type recombinase/integrase [Aquibium oceanicum]|uniref:tyrosine-type recombinase/integrase n=1 Tax=Aquibium oceanicum TaxID=1670800 RepID=UPI0036139220